MDYLAANAATGARRFEILQMIELMERLMLAL